MPRLSTRATELMTSFAAINSADPARRGNGLKTTLPKLKDCESLDYKRSAAGIVSTRRHRHCFTVDPCGRRLFHELFVADETDALHAIALGNRQHLGHGIVIGTTFRTHVQLGLRVLG